MVGRGRPARPAGGALFIFVVLLLLPLRPAFADSPSAVVNGDLRFDNINLSGFPGSTAGSLTINGGTPIGFTTDPTGNAFLNRPQTGNHDLVSGDVIHVTVDTADETLTLANLAITSVDYTNNTVYGTSDDTAAVSVNVFGPTNGSMNATDTGTGTWAADFGTFDVTYAHHINAQVADLDGDATIYGQSPVTINGDLGNDNVNVSGFPGSTAGTLTINGGAATNFTTDPNGNAFPGRGQHGQDLVPANVLEVSVGAITKSLTLADLAVTGVDYVNNVVSGTAAAPGSVSVNVFGPTGSFMNATATGATTWEANFGAFDITFIHFVQAQIPEASGDGDATMFTKAPTNINADLPGNQVNVSGFPGSTAGTLTINGGTPTNFTTNPSGHAFLGQQQHGRDLIPADVLDVSVGGVSKSLTLANLAVTTVNYVDNIVSGTADTPGAVQVNVFGPTGSSMNATATGATTWEADFDAFDITFNHFVNAQILDADGDATTFGKGPSSINGDLGNDNVGIFGFPGGTAGTLTINGGTPIGFTTDPTGNAFLPPAGDLVPGDVLEVTVGALTKSLTLQAVAITLVDPETETVTGTAAASSISLDIFGPGTGEHVDAVPVTGGNWSHTFASIAYSHGSSARIFDPEGDATVYSKSPPKIEADLTFDGINANDFAPNDAGSVTISGVAGSFPITTDGRGNASLNRETHHEDLTPGRTVTVTVAGFSKSLTLGNLAITEVNPNTNTVSGTADASTVEVNVCGSGGCEFAPEVAVTAGTWSHTFTTDITPDSHASARVRDAENDATNTNTGIARIEAHLGPNEVNVTGFPPNRPGTLDITGVPTVNFTTDGGGNTTIDNSQINATLVAGQTVTVTVDSTSKSVVLANLSIVTANPTDEVVTGTADDGAIVRVHTGDETNEASRQTGPVSGGTWSVDFDPDFDLGRYSGVQARIEEPDGDATTTDKEAAVIGADLLWDNIEIGNFPANATGTITINGTPVSETFSTDEWGNEYFDRSRHNTDLVVGTTIVATVGSFSKSVTLESLAISTVNLDTEEVFGTAGNGRPGRVNAFDEDEGSFEDFTTNGSGLWSVQFDEFNLRGSTEVSAEIPDLEGDATIYARRVPHVAATVQWNFIDADQFPAESTLTFELYSSEGGTLLTTPPVEIVADEFGHAGFSPEDGVTLAPGMFVRVSGGGFTKELNIVDVAITGVDTENNRARGIAPASMEAFVTASDQENEQEQMVLANDPENDGTWLASFSFDIVGGTVVWLNVPDEDGDSSDATANGQSLNVDMDGDTIHAAGFPQGGTLTFTIHASEDGAQLGSPITRPANPDGVEIGFADHGQNLEPPMFVRVTDGFGTKELSLVPLTIDQVNPDTNIVSGTTDPNTPVYVFIPFLVDLQRCCPDKEDVSDGTGAWSVLFDQVEPELGGDGDVLEPANVAFAQITDDDGDGAQRQRAATETSSGTTGSGGGTVTTDETGGDAGATPEDPVETSVTTQDSGTVTISETQSTGTAPSGYSFLDQQINITAPPGTVADPLVLVFTIDASLIPEGETAETIQIFRNGVLVPACNNQTGNASPNPCVGNRQALGNGDIEITVLTSDASAWNFGVGGGPPPPNLALSAAAYTVAESGDSATITVVRSGGTGPVAVAYALSNGTATAGDDFDGTSGVVSFAEGETSKTFQVPVNEDARFEGSETFTVTLTSANNGGLILSPSSATVTITDNDTAPVLQFSSAATLSVGENVGTTSLTVTRTGATENEVSVNYALGPGTATPGLDFTLDVGTLTLGEGETSKTIDIQITNDTAAESVETLSVRLSTPTGGALLGTPHQATVEIGASDQQPDALVGLKDSAKFMSGNDVYNTDGTNQSVSVNGQAGQTKTFFARICNDGTQTNTLTIRGTSGAGGAAISYVKGNQNITTAMTSVDGYSFTLGKGSCVSIKILITAGSTTGEYAALVTASWSGDGILADTVKASVLVP